MGIVSLSMVQWLLRGMVVLNTLHQTLASGDSKISCMKCIISCTSWKGEVKTLKPEHCPFYKDSCIILISKTKMDQGKGIGAVYQRNCNEIRRNYDETWPGCRETIDMEKQPVIECVCTTNECNGGNNLTAIMEAAERSAEHFNITAHEMLISDMEKSRKSKSSQVLSGTTIWIAAFILLYYLVFEELDNKIPAIIV